MPYLQYHQKQPKEDALVEGFPNPQSSVRDFQQLVIFVLFPDSAKG
jgi:hypothetical protein